MQPFALQTPRRLHLADSQRASTWSGHDYRGIWSQVNHFCGGNHCLTGISADAAVGRAGLARPLCSDLWEWLIIRLMIILMMGYG